MKNTETNQKHKAHKTKTSGKKFKNKKGNALKKKQSSNSSSENVSKDRPNLKAFEYKTGLKAKIKSSRSIELSQKKYHSKYNNLITIISLLINSQCHFWTKMHLNRHQISLSSKVHQK